jgi:hypothetical protein
MVRASLGEMSTANASAGPAPGAAGGDDEPPF